MRTLFWISDISEILFVMHSYFFLNYTQPFFDTSTSSPCRPNLRHAGRDTIGTDYSTSCLHISELIMWNVVYFTANDTTRHDSYSLPTRADAVHAKNYVSEVPVKQAWMIQVRSVIISDHKKTHQGANHVHIFGMYCSIDMTSKMIKKKCACHWLDSGSGLMNIC